MEELVTAAASRNSLLRVVIPDRELTVQDMDWALQQVMETISFPVSLTNPVIRRITERVTAREHNRISTSISVNSMRILRLLQ